MASLIFYEVNFYEIPFCTAYTFLSPAIFFFKTQLHLNLYVLHNLLQALGVSKEFITFEL